MVVLIGLLGIYFTHKVAGPVYKMKRLLKQVGQGNLRVEARLRKGDELQDFFDTFTQMVAGPARPGEADSSTSWTRRVDALGPRREGRGAASLGTRPRRHEGHARGLAPPSSRWWRL